MNETQRKMAIGGGLTMLLGVAGTVFEANRMHSPEFARQEITSEEVYQEDVHRGILVGSAAITLVGGLMFYAGTTDRDRGKITYR